MANKYLVKYDFETLIKEDNLDELLVENDRVLTDSIDSAVEEVAGYIRHRYDESQVFAVQIPYTDLTAFVIGDRIFWSETAYSTATTYNSGDRVSYLHSIYVANKTTTPGAFNAADWDLLGTNNSFYVCTADSTGNLPTDTDYFSAGDNRNAKIKEITIDIVLYNLHSRLSPHNIPDVRRTRYDGFGNQNDSGNALRYLEKVQRATIAPNLPEIEPEEQNQERVAYGVSSNLKYKY